MSARRAPIRKRGTHYDEEWDSEIGKWVRIKDSRSGSMETQNGRRDRRKKSRNNSRKNSRRHSVRRGSSRAVTPKPTRQRTVGFQDPPRTPRRTSSGRRMSRRRASQSPEETLTSAKMTGREYRESKAKEKATKKMLEQEAAEKKERDEKANAPKPKNDKFVLPTEERKRGTGDYILENWVMDEENDKMNKRGTKRAGGRVYVPSADRRKVGEPEDSADWVAVRDQNNEIVHVRASRLYTKPDADKEIGDIAKKEEEGKELTEEEKKMKVELDAMDKELADINKDEGAVLNPDAVETPQTRRDEAKRLQEMREKLRTLRYIKDDEAIRRMEIKLNETQQKRDHPEPPALEVDDSRLPVGGDVPRGPPAFETGLLGDNDTGLSGGKNLGLRRRRSSVYPLGTRASHLKSGRADTFPRHER